MFRVQTTEISVLLASCFTLITQTYGHGYMIEPPARASMWRDGFNTPKNYNDNKLFCGGYGVQWSINGGRCGACGDPYNAPRQNEAGGLYATGTIGRNYTEGQTIPVAVHLTMNHGGYFEFRICPNNNPSKAVSGSCLNKHLLTSANGQSRFKQTPGKTGRLSYNLVLPRGLTCSQCVLQWKWNTASNWACDDDGCGHDHGKQEQYYNCADVAIFSSGTGNGGTIISGGSIPGSGNGGVIVSGGNIPVIIGGSNSGSSNGGSLVSGGTGTKTLCEAVPAWKLKYAYADQWCVTQCAAGNCPAQYCKDSCRQRQTLFG